MKRVNARLVTIALVILGTLDLAKDIMPDVLRSFGLEQYSDAVRLIGFLLTAYTTQQSRPFPNPIRRRKNQPNT